MFSLSKQQLASKIKEESLGLTYDDIFMVPRYSDIKSRSDVDTTIEKNDWSFKLPIIASPMNTVCEEEMAIKMAEHGGLGVIHRYNSIAQQAEMVRKCKGHTIAAAIGATNDYMERAQELHNAGCEIFCVDVAHGNHQYVRDALNNLRKEFDDDKMIMAGNTADYIGAQNLASWGANMIRIGVGAGSACTTRVRTGHGIPSITSLIDSSRQPIPQGVILIADGGIRSSGDIVKALAVGADMVMLGSMLAGTDEAPGEKIIEDGKEYKAFRGMASKEAQNSWRGKVSVAEGVSSKVPVKGPADNILIDLKKGIQSGFSYSGARNLKEFRKSVEFGIQSQSSIREGLPHIKFGE